MKKRASDDGIFRPPCKNFAEEFDLAGAGDMQCTDFEVDPCSLRSSEASSAPWY